MSNVLKTTLVMLLLAGAAAEAGAQDRRTDGESRARAETRRGWLGLVYGPVEGREWMAVRQVVDGSPAERAGLSAGDTIVAWNGSRSPMSAALDGGPEAGETVRLRLRRAGRERDVSMRASESPRRRMVVHLDREGEPIVIRSPILSLDGSGREILLHVDSLAVHADSLHSQLRVMLRDSLGPILRRLEETEMPRIREELERAQREMSRDMPRIRAEARELERELEREMPRIRAEARRAERDLAREMARVTVAGGLALGSRSVAGAEFSELNEGLADYFGTDRGVLVLRVAPDTPAERSGLRAGDVVVSARGRAVQRVQELREAVLESRDRDVELVVVRRGTRQGLRLRWE